MKLKALSIIQPWAGFILCGEKRVENRTWKTYHRGPLLIHSSRSSVGLDRGVDDNWFQLAGLIRHDAKSRLEFGCGSILGIVNLVDCRLATGMPPTPWHDPSRLFGNSYWWELADVVIFQTPIPAKGQQMLWTADVDVSIALIGECPTLESYLARFRSDRQRAMTF